MARMPGTTWVGEQSPGTPMSRYDVVCVHTIVGYAPAHAAHFSVRADGEILQSRDTAYRSAANLDGNPRVLAIENEDHGPAFGGTPQLPRWVPLTDEQVDANAQILAWAHEEHGIPLQLCPDSRPSSRGLAYHRQGVDGNFAGYDFPGRVGGGEVWTEHFGKVCPTDARIAQLPEILSRARALTEGDPMAQYEDQLARIAADAAASRRASEELAADMKRFRDRDTKRTARVVGKLKRLIDQGAATRADLDELRADLEAEE